VFLLKQDIILLRVCSFIWHRREFGPPGYVYNRETTTAPAYTPDGDITHMTNLGLKCNDPNSSEDGLFFYQRGLEKADGTVPILVLIHGYPET
jgi:hypothetical protein